CIFFLSCLFSFATTLFEPSAFAQPDGFKGTVASEKAIVLHLQQNASKRATLLPQRSLLVPLDQLQFTGPAPSHPFMLGSFASDGKWGLVDGYVQPVDGKN